jgi:transcriptional regulator with XRE-family HTH domain
MIEDMIERIGRAHPPRLYIREWMSDKGLDNKRLAERMGRAEGTVSKLLSAADQNPEKRSRQKITIEYLAEFADALNIEVAMLFRDPASPTRDELLRGYSNEQLTTALQLIEHSRAIGSPKASGVVSSDSDAPKPRRVQKRAGADR